MTILQAFEIIYLGFIENQVFISVFLIIAFNQKETNCLATSQWPTITLWIDRILVIKIDSDRIDLQSGYQVIYLIYFLYSSTYKFV